MINFLCVSLGAGYKIRIGHGRLLRLFPCRDRFTQTSGIVIMMRNIHMRERAGPKLGRAARMVRRAKFCHTGGQRRHPKGATITLNKAGLPASSLILSILLLSLNVRSSVSLVPRRWHISRPYCGPRTCRPSFLLHPDRHSEWSTQEILIQTTSLSFPVNSKESRVAITPNSKLRLHSAARSLSC